VTNAGLATSVVISDLLPGTTYYFSVTAYNTSGVESLPSAEVSYLTPGTAPSPTPVPNPTPTPAPTATPLPTATPVPPPPTPTPVPLDKNLTNVSTRANVLSGDNVLIGGLIIVGNTPKTVVVRAIGPSLATAGIANALGDPTLTIYSSTGAVIGANDNWRNGADASSIQALGMAPSKDAESALLATLAPGAYTAMVSGVNGGHGVALLEVYDAQLNGSRIANISTRGKVETSDKMMIGGFVIGGSQSMQVLVRAMGPSLAKFGVTGALLDPVLDLYNGNGSKIFSNDNWKTSQRSQITATNLAPSDDREAAIIATLAPGDYTAIVHGAKSTTGVALVEVYSVGN
jgi:hypothetical protein